MPANPGYDFSCSGDDAGLRAAQEFVAAEHYDGDAGFDALTDQRFRDSGGGEIDQAAGAQVFDQRQVYATAQCRQFFD